MDMFVLLKYVLGMVVITIGRCCWLNWVTDIFLKLHKGRPGPKID